MSIFDSLKRQAESSIKREASKAVTSAVNSAVQSVGKGRNRSETFTFKEDGTGKYSFEDGDHWEYTFTYAWYDGDYLEFVYDDDGTVGGFTVRIEGDVMYLSNLSVVDMPLVRK